MEGPSGVLCNPTEDFITPASHDLLPHKGHACSEESMRHSEGQATYVWISPVFPIQEVCCQPAYLCCLVLLIFQQEVANSPTLVQGVFQSRILLGDDYRFLIPLGQPAASASTPLVLQDLAVIAGQMVIHYKPGAQL